MRIKPAVIITWPLHIDFPVCRWNLERFQDYFSAIYIGFSNHHVENQNLSNFIRNELPFAQCFDIKRIEGGDWRNDSVNYLLDQVDKNITHVLFLEQDFLLFDKTLLEKVFDSEKDFVYYKEHERIHPAFALVKRSLVDATSRDFGAHPPGDHFFKFFAELPDGTQLEELGIQKKVDYIHMAGLSQNYKSFTYGESFYQPINFLYFNYKSMQLPNQHPLFHQFQGQIEKMYGHPLMHTYLDRFFPV